MIVTTVFLSGCGLSSSDSDEMFDCLSEFGEEDGCNLNMAMDIIPLGVKDFIEKGEYDMTLEGTTIEGYITQLGNNLELQAIVEFDVLVISVSMIESIVNLTENLYNDALEGGVELHSVIVAFRHFNYWGYDTISVVKLDAADDGELIVHYHTNSMNLNTVIEEKEVIASLFRYQEVYNINYKLSYIDETKDYTIDPKLSLNLYGERESDYIEYYFYSYNDVDVDFEENDFYQNLFDEFPGKQFTYNE